MMMKRIEDEDKNDEHAANIVKLDHFMDYWLAINHIR